MPGIGRRADLSLTAAERAVISRLRTAGAGEPPLSSKALQRAANHRASLFPVGDQGPHASCIAFAVTAICEFRHQRSRKLSERYLHFKAASTDANAAAGMRLAAAFSAVRSYGICGADLWPYAPASWPSGEPGFPSAAADEDARQYRMLTAQPVAAGDIHGIKRLLAGEGEHHGAPVAVGLALLEGHQDDRSFNEFGQLRLPDEPRDPASGHAMVFIGYQDDERLPGGGYFIARNSWGENWAPRSREGAGHALVAYDYARAFMYEAMAGEPPPYVEGRAQALLDPPPHWASILLDREERDATGSLLPAGIWALRFRGRFYRDTPRNRRAADASHNIRY